MGEKLQEYLKDNNKKRKLFWQNITEKMFKRGKTKILKIRTNGIKW